uniref:Odorant receptor n=1 Tax=Heliothis virescens TaxID=7102 RepID=A0A2A4J6Z3_HELVI
MEPTTYTRSQTTEFFYKINFLIYLFGLPNFWIEELKLSKTFVKIYDKFLVFSDGFIYLLILLEFGSFFTQTNLTEKQMSNLVVFAMSHPVLCSFGVIMSRLKKKIRLVMYSLAVSLKREYNDPVVEKQMISHSVTYVSALSFSYVMTMIMYAADAFWDMIHNGSTFTTIVTAYPDVDDRSELANIARAFFFIIWWIFLTRFFAVYLLVIPLTTGLSYQFKNLQSYFSSLADIFDSNELSQTDKEEKYETGFKVGVKLHADTLRCVQDTQAVCRGVFSGQIIFNILLLILLMAQMVNSERTLVNIFGTVTTAGAVLISTGFYMWNAGDVTVEASRLPTAIYFSGWYHCRGQSSVRLRKLIVIAMSRAQQPVVLKGLGYIDLSYQSYITIVKSSYSVFSVLY